MEENNVCRFCLKNLVDQNFNIVGDTTLEILNILSIEIDLSIAEKSPMCRTCQGTIDRCFTFKSACISSEDSIAEYITEDSKVDLEEVYLKAELKRVPKDHKICRLCMKITITAECLNTTDTLFALASDKLRKCIPEFDLYIVKQPVICEACLAGLQRYYEFVTCCLDVEKKINRYCEARGVDKRQVRLYNVLQFILNESLASDISKRVVSNKAGKLDEDQLNIEVNCTELDSVRFDDRMGTIDVKSEDEKKSCSNKINGNSETGVINNAQVQCPEADQFTKNDNINCNKEIYNLDAEENRCSHQLRLSTKHSFKENSVAEICIKSEEIDIKSDADMSANKDCDSQDNTLPQIKSGKKKHNVARRIKNKVFFCEICSTSYHSKYLLERHNLLVHVEDPLVKLFRCKQCSFISEYKESLNNHKKVHKGNSELNMHKCKECEFTTKYKGNLKAHSLARHQDSPEVQVSNEHVLHHSKVKIYTCSLCNYDTKFKRHLVYHAMTHKDKSELPTYDCFHCSYKAKRKSHLRNHMKVHKTMPEFIMLKSETCDFISEDNSSVTSHKDQSDTWLNSCDKGTFATNHKSRLKNDMLIQTDSSQLKMFKCEICLYQATSSTELNQHSFIHSEVKQELSTTYNCTHCSYKTRHKKYLKLHLFIHNDKSLGELPSFKCFLCSYQTARKKNLERHLQSHKRGSVIELWKCKICGGEYSKFHVKTHQRTCVGQEDDRPDSHNRERTEMTCF